MEDCNIMSKSVLVLTNNIGGLHSFRKEVISAIRAAGYEVIISSPDYNESVAYFESIGCKKVETEFKSRGTNPLADLRLMLAYRHLIKTIKPVAVLTYTIKPNVYGGIACRITGTPQLANVTGLGDAVENGGWMQKLTLFLYKVGISKSYKIFFQNRVNRDFFIQHHIASNDSVLLPGSGVNLSHNVYQPYPANDGITRFLFIGRMLKDKGIEEYFKTAKYIQSKCTNVEFQILGSVEGPYQAQLDELVQAGVIKHLGTTSDVRPFIGAVECTIMPSYHEGMSNVNLESAANGRPVITTDVPGCRETVDDGVTGLLVKPRSTKDLMAKVEMFIKLSYEKKIQMGEAARKKVEAEFDRNIVVKAYLDAINSIEEYV